MSDKETRYVRILTNIVVISMATVLAWAGWVSIALITVLQDVAVIGVAHEHTNRKLEVIISRLQRADENFIAVVYGDGSDGRQKRSAVQPDAGKGNRSL